MTSQLSGTSESAKSALSSIIRITTQLTHAEALVAAARRELGQLLRENNLDVWPLLSTPTQLSGAIQVADELDEAGLALDTTVRAAVALLQSQGRGRRKDVVAAALRLRRQRATGPAT